MKILALTSLKMKREKRKIWVQDIYKIDNILEYNVLLLSRVFQISSETIQYSIFK